MSRTYWIHRISHHAEVAYPLLEKSLLSIGFSDFSSQPFIDECGDNWERFEEYFEEKWDCCPRIRYTLWRFVFEMKKGDYVVVPSWGTFSVFELDEDKPLLTTQIDLAELVSWNNTKIIKGDDNLLHFDDENKLLDLGFFRKVTPIAVNMSRNDYADNRLTSRMKIRQTNVQCNDLKESIDCAIENFRKNKPINIHSIILEEIAEKMLGLIKTNLTSDKFERLIELYLLKSGASITEIPAKNANKEGDADIVATFETIKTIVYVQAKFHTGDTDSWAINQIKDYKDNKELMDDGYSKIAWVITSADKFTVECDEQAKQANVRLINGNEFARMLINSGISNLINM